MQEAILAEAETESISSGPQDQQRIVETSSDNRERLEASSPLVRQQHQNTRSMRATCSKSSGCEAVRGTYLGCPAEPECCRARYQNKSRLKGGLDGARRMKARQAVVAKSEI